MNYFETLKRVLVIAEIGVNHNGDVALAKKMIDTAKDSGADAVKFQTFTAEGLAMQDTPKVQYQLNTTSNHETHFQMLRNLELGKKEHYEIANYCQQREIDFLSTPYDVQSAQFLAELNVRFFKTASADLVDLPLQRFIASTRLPTMVATGMATLGEVERVVRIYNELDNPNLILLHCVSNYPCSDVSLNLRAMQNMGLAFSVPYGFSDHSEGYLAAVASVAMGSRVIEKHFTLDKALPGPDHKASSNPAEFSDLVRSVRRVEEMLGNPHKACQPEERQMAEVSRKSLVLRRGLRAGQPVTDEHLELKRPGTGISASFLPEILGKLACVDLPAGHRLKWGDLRDAQ
jgi:N,N'-diacetyllegionaminate synthase